MSQSESEFNDPVDPSGLPKRRCSTCGGTMTAVDAGTDAFQPTARYACGSCSHSVKITPPASSAGWLVLAGIAFSVIAALTFVSKSFDVWSLVFLIATMSLLFPHFIRQLWRLKRHPALEGEPILGPLTEGALGSIGFLAIVGLVAGLLIFGFERLGG